MAKCIKGDKVLKIIREYSHSLVQLKDKSFARVSLSWLTRNIQASEIHARILIVFYLILLALGVFLFVNFNYVPTRKCDIQVEEIKSSNKNTIDTSLGMYRCEQPGVDISINVPMTLQPDNDCEGTIDCNLSVGQFTHLDKNTHPIYLYKALKRNTNSEVALIDADFVEHDPDVSLKEELFSKLLYKPVYYSSSYKNRLIDSLKNECDVRIPSDSISDYEYYVKVRQQTNERVLFQSSKVKFRRDNSLRLDDSGFKQSDVIGNAKDFTNIAFYKVKSIVSTICFGISQRGGILSTPSWYSLADLSQSYYVFKLETCTFDRMTLSINFKGATNFSKMSPEPDEVTMNEIKFTDAYKIEQIKRNGCLKFHAEFNEMKNKQNVRNFALTSLMALVIGAFIKELFVLMYHYVSQRRQTIKKS